MSMTDGNSTAPENAWWYREGDTTGGPLPPHNYQRPIVNDLYGAYMVRHGWECPRCKRINNPDLQQCLCGPPTFVYMSSYGSSAGEEFVQHSPIDESDFSDLSFLTQKPKWSGRWQETPGKEELGD